MKKFKFFALSVFFVLLLVQSSFASGLEIGANYAMGGSIGGSLLGIPVSFTDPGGIGVNLAYFGKISDQVEIGGGLVYFLPRTINKMDVGGTPVTITGESAYNYMPVYGAIKFVLNPGSKEAKFYVGGDIRYGLISVAGNAWDGITPGSGLGYGVFAGLDVAKRMSLRIGYAIQNGSFAWAAPINSTQNVSENIIYISGNLLI